jgi:DNA-binding transcriptional MerR regulator
MTTTVSSIADLGLRADILCYYQRLGLLRPARRSAAGYRFYDEASAERFVL